MPGLLLVNLGTPDAPTPAAVRRYLRQFLSDPRVIDIHPIARALLLELVILPVRPRRSAAAYAKVWTDRGSPLLFHSLDLVDAVRARLTGGEAEGGGGAWHVELGMRYGEPSIPAALERLRQAGAEPLVALPLYPQYSSAATGSSVEAIFSVMGRRWVTEGIAILEDFYEAPAFLDAFVEVGRPIVAAERAASERTHVLYSFHGLPERHVKKCDPTGRHCLASAACCDAMVPDNRHCYRAQCFATARGLSARLALGEGDWSVSFQSRLGRTPWVKPYTDEVLPDLARRGVRRLVVYCPSFVADCLETLEEIGIRAREQWKALGGEELTLVPSLNATPAWADSVAAMARRLLPGASESSRR